MIHIIYVDLSQNKLNFSLTNYENGNIPTLKCLRIVKDRSPKMAKHTQERIPYLDFIGEDKLPCRVEIKGNSFCIGRAYENDLRIEDSRVSRRHAEILKLADGHFTLYDLDSKGGCYVNGVRVKEHRLQPGDVIVLGGINAARLTFGYSYKTGSTFDSLESIRTGEMKSNIHLQGATLITEQQTRYLNTELMLQPQYITDSTLKRLTLLYEMTHKLLPVQSVHELAEIWMESLFKVLPVERGVIMIFDEQSDRLKTILKKDLSLQESELSEMHFSNSIIEKTFLENVAVLTNDASSDERFSDHDSVIFENIRSVIAAPITSKMRVWGVCYLDSRTQTALFNSEDLEFLMATAREAGLVLENLKLIEELRTTQEQLIKAERLATIGKLTSSISHELRNRLALLTGIEFIEMKYGHDPEVKLFTEMVLTGQRRALALVEEIRDFARNKPERYEMLEHELVPAIERTLSILKLDPAVHKRTLEFSYSANPVITFNEDKIEQVIINLIRNAVEATREEDGRILVTVCIEDHHAVIRVSDNGCGIPPENLPKIWEPFYSTKGEEGTGLGLEICRRIIEAHGGLINCDSEVGKGTTFTIYLPFDCKQVKT